MAVGERHRKIAGSLDGARQHGFPRFLMRLYLTGPIRHITAYGYSGVRGAYQLLRGDRATSLYGSHDKPIQSFETLRDKINNEESGKARLQSKTKDPTSVVISFKNETSRYRCPQDKFPDQLQRRLLAKNIFGMPIIKIEASKLREYINKEQENDPEQIENVAKAKTSSNRVRELPDSLKPQIEQELRVAVPLPLQERHLDNVQHILDAGGKDLLESSGITKRTPQERFQIIKELRKLPHNEITEIQRQVLEAKTPDERSRVLENVLDAHSLRSGRQERSVTESGGPAYASHLDALRSSRPPSPSPTSSQQSLAQGAPPLPSRPSGNHR
jgi:hypothetical protein